MDEPSSTQATGRQRKQTTPESAGGRPAACAEQRSVAGAGHPTVSITNALGTAARPAFNPAVGTAATQLGRGDMRSEPRFLVKHDPALVTALVGPELVPVQARLLDLSHSGLGLLVDVHLPTNAWIKVEFGATIIFGEVRHCRLMQDGQYRLGARSDTVLFRKVQEEPVDAARLSRDLWPNPGLVNTTGP